MVYYFPLVIVSIDTNHELGPKHFEAQVKVLNIVKTRASIEYLSAGYNSEAIGDKAEVDLIRLKPVIEPIFRLKPQSYHLVGYVREILREKKLAASVAEIFIKAR